MFEFLTLKPAIAVLACVSILIPAVFLCLSYRWHDRVCALPAQVRHAGALMLIFDVLLPVAAMLFLWALLLWHCMSLVP